MKKHLTLLSFFIFGIVLSQTNRFIYQLQMKLNDKMETLNMVLDIDEKYVKFYDDEFLKNDSISKKTGDIWQTTTTSDQLIIRPRNSFHNKSYRDNIFDYFVIESEDKINWKIESETKKSGEYTLQKATTSFGDRNWIAWFCPSIPFQEGPYKFRGLPGLIFELHDKENNFIYSLVKSMNFPKTFETQNFLETHYGKKPVPVSLKQFFKVKLDYYNDPMAEMKKNLNKGGTIMIGGEKITTQDQLDQRKKFMQKAIKGYYNPLELDKAIPYPKD